MNISLTKSLFKLKRQVRPDGNDILANEQSQQKIEPADCTAVEDCIEESKSLRRNRRLNSAAGNVNESDRKSHPHAKHEGAALDKRSPRFTKPRVDPFEGKSHLSAEDCLDQFKQSKSPRSTPANKSNDIDRESFSQILAKLGAVKEGGRRGTFVPRWVLFLIENSTDAILFGQLFYWESFKNPPWPERGLELGWVAKTDKELTSEIGRSEASINKSLNRLKKAGLITWQVRKFSGTRQRHISIVWRQVEVAYRRLAQEYPDWDH